MTNFIVSIKPYNYIKSGGIIELKAPTDISLYNGVVCEAYGTVTTEASCALEVDILKVTLGFVMGEVT